MRHQAHISADILGRKDAESVGQVDAGHPQSAQQLNLGEDVVEGIANPIRPVLEIDVDRKPPASRIAYCFLDLGAVFFGGQSQLAATMLLRTLGEQVQHLPPHIGDPIHGHLMVAVAEHLYALNDPGLAGPFSDGASGLPFPFGNPRGGDLDAVHLEFQQQHLCELELFGRRVGDVRSLLPIAQGRVHDGDLSAMAGVFAHDFRLAMASCNRENPRSFASPAVAAGRSSAPRGLGGA